MLQASLESGPAARSPRDARADTKARLLEAADRLLRERGSADLTTREITAAAGVNVAAIHYHFGTKDGLLAAVVRHVAEPALRIQDRYLAALEHGRPTVRQVAEAIVRPLAEFTSGDPRSWGRAFTPDPTMTRLYDDLFAERRIRFERLLAAAQPHVDAVTIEVRIALGFKLAFRSYFDPDGGLLARFDAGAFEDELVEFVERGLGGRGHRREGGRR